MSHNKLLCLHMSNNKPSSRYHKLPTSNTKIRKHTLNKLLPAS